jgi:hypothetical protein
MPAKIKPTSPRGIIPRPTVSPENKALARINRMALRESAVPVWRR